MAKYYIGVECPLCGDIIREGLCMDMTQPDNTPPTVLLNNFEQVHFYCDTCGTQVYTGDMDQMCEVEEGELPDEDDDEDEEDWEDE